MAESELLHRGSPPPNGAVSPKIEDVSRDVVGDVIEDFNRDEPALDNKKRKRGEDGAAISKKPKKEPKPRVNTAIYITGLPLDATFGEIKTAFSKYGLISNNIDSELPKIKMYSDDDGKFKGDALVTYYQAQSVPHAILLADGSDIRLGGAGSVRVQEANLDYKKEKREVTQEDQGGKKKHVRKDTEKIKRMTKEMNARLTDWDDDDPQTMPEYSKPVSKWDQCVIVKGLFTMDEIKKNPAEIIDIKEDVREQAAEEGWGEITKVVVYDLEPEGVVLIRFATVDGAQKGLHGMDGRWFDRRQLQAYVPTSKPKYKQSDRRDLDDENLADDVDAAEAQRLEAFGNALEAEDNENEQEDVQDGGNEIN